MYSIKKEDRVNMYHMEPDEMNLQEITTRVDNLIRKMELPGMINYSIIILPIRTVGVQGDGRSYGYVVNITIEKPNLNEEEYNKLLSEISTAITNHIQEVNRVVVTIRNGTHNYF